MASEKSYQGHNMLCSKMYGHMLNKWVSRFWLSEHNFARETLLKNVHFWQIINITLKTAFYLCFSYAEQWKVSLKKYFLALVLQLSSSLSYVICSEEEMCVQQQVLFYFFLSLSVSSSFLSIFSSGKNNNQSNSFSQSV